MKNMLYACLTTMFFVIALILFFIFFDKKDNKKDIDTNNGDKINIYNSDNKKIVENKNYNFELVLDEDAIVSGYDQFIEISDENCSLNVSSEKNNEDVCEKIKNECNDLGCNKYICEKYIDDWYKTIEYGDFAGSGDIILSKKSDDYTYFLNLECKDKNKDNINNILLDRIINGFDIKDNY